MSAEIGHEMNNFVGVVAGNLSLLDFHIRKGNTKDLGKYVTAMVETIEKIKKFTANLMDLTPISSEKAVLSFDKLLTEVIDYLKPQKRYRDVSIRVDNLPDNLPFEADTTQIQQLLYNLFNNAADATQDSARREITVNIVRIDEDCYFRFVITDTGCGFPTDLLQKAFQERFTTKKLGHGFGLVVCKRIIENHGGRLQVDSSPGAGTTISILFPIAGMVQKPLDPVPTDTESDYDKAISVPAACGFRAG
jgi:two-component system, NtrC family, sensor histidine kinase HydH